MNLTGKIINKCYYVGGKAIDSLYTNNWSAKSIFSDYHVILKFLKHKTSIYPKVKLQDLKNVILKLFNVYHSDLEKILEIDEYMGYTFIAAEYTAGIPLHEFENTGIKISFEDKIYILIKICKALEYAHKINLIHKTLSPENVLVLLHHDKIQNIKIVNFAFFEFEELFTEKTKRRVDTKYFAPEIIKGKHIDHQSDIFSVGCIFFWLLTGKLPFSNKEEKLKGDYIIKLPALKNKAIKQILELIINKSLQKDPEHRYKSITALLQDLIRFNAHKINYDVMKSYEMHENKEIAGNLINNTDFKEKDSVFKDLNMYSDSPEFHFMQKYENAGKEEIEYEESYSTLLGKSKAYDWNGRDDFFLGGENEIFEYKKRVHKQEDNNESEWIDYFKQINREDLYEKSGKFKKIQRKNDKRKPDINKKKSNKGGEILKRDNKDELHQMVSKPEYEYDWSIRDENENLEKNKSNYKGDSIPFLEPADNIEDNERKLEKYKRFTGPKKSKSDKSELKESKPDESITYNFNKIESGFNKTKEKYWEKADNRTSTNQINDQLESDFNAEHLKKKKNKDYKESKEVSLFIRREKDLDERKDIKFDEIKDKDKAEGRDKAEGKDKAEGRDKAVGKDKAENNQEEDKKDETRKIKRIKTIKKFPVEEFSSFCEVSYKGNKLDINQFKMLFYNTFEYRGSICFLILSEDYRPEEELRLINYFRDYFIYNHGIFLNIDCKSRHPRYYLYYELLNKYIFILSVIKELDSSEIKEILKENFNKTIDKFIKLYPETSMKFDLTAKDFDENSDIEHEVIKESYLKLLSTICSILSPVTVFLNNINYLGKKSLLLLKDSYAFVKEAPMLFLGISIEY